MKAAKADPYRGYACDGDQRWTAESVRDWWRDRARVTEHDLDGDFAEYLAGELR